MVISAQALAQTSATDNPSPTAAQPSVPAQEKPAAAAEEKPPAADDKPATVEQKPAPAEEKPAIAQDKPAAVEEKSAATDDKPAVVEQKPAPAEAKPAVAQDKPAAVEEKPAATDDKPAIVEQKPARRRGKTSGCAGQARSSRAEAACRGRQACHRRAEAGRPGREACGHRAEARACQEKTSGCAPEARLETEVCRQAIRQALSAAQRQSPVNRCNRPGQPTSRARGPWSCSAPSSAPTIRRPRLTGATTARRIPADRPRARRTRSDKPFHPVELMGSRPGSPEVRFFRLLRRRLAVIVSPDYLKFNRSNRSNSLNAAAAQQAPRIQPTDVGYNAR